MCMFSRPVEHVSATQIFARGLDDGRQVLVYSMQLAAKEPLAMVLPVPVPPGSADDAVELVNLEGYPTFFDDLKRAFPETILFAPQTKSRAPRLSANTVLKVEQVGAFEASFVPSPADFARLDPRFRLPPGVFAALPQYADWGFVVFQLDKTKQKRVHPMAFRFPRRDRESLFFPTVHVHDGSVPATAHFDHHLFAQLPPLLEALMPLAWESSTARLGNFVEPWRALGLVEPDAYGRGTLVVGAAPNRDHVYRAPAGISLDDLCGSGAQYAYRVQARYHFVPEGHSMYPAWHAAASTHLPALCRGLRSGLAELVAANARAWQLAPLVDGMRPHFMNGPQLWSGTSYMNGTATLTPGPGMVRFTPFTSRVEQQDITLAFAEIPDVDGAKAIDRALAAMLDRAISA